MENVSKSWWQQALQNRIIALVLAMIVIVPLVATPASASVNGMAALAFEGFAIVLLVALLWRSKWNLNRENLAAFAKSGANLPILGFLGLAAVSCVASGTKGYSTQALLQLAAGVMLYFVVASQFRRSEQLAKLVDALLLVTIAASLFGFAQFGAGAGKFATGLFADHQLFGSFLMILLPIVGVVAVTEKNTNRQLAAQAATVLAGTCLLLSHSRSAWVGALVSLVVILGLSLFTAARKEKLTARKHEIVLPIMLLLIAGGFFLLVSPQTNSILNRVGTLSSASKDSTFQIRQATWKGASQMIAAKPVFGFGYGNYAVKSAAYTGYGKPIDRIGGQATLSENAHNFWLQTTAETGIVGLLLMASVLVVFWATGLRRLSGMEAGLRRSLLIGSLASTVAFAVDGFASPSWQFGQVSMFFWLALGLGAACMRPQSRKREEEEVRVVSSRVSRPATVFAALGLAALLPTIAFAAGDLYATPVSARLVPGPTVTIRGGAAQPFQLYVTFRKSDNSLEELNVTLCDMPNSKTTFSKTGGLGFLTGANNSVYQSRVRERDTVTIGGTYSQTATATGQITGSATASPTTVTVRFP